MAGHDFQRNSFQQQQQRVPGFQGQGRRRKGNWNLLKSQNVRGATKGKILHHLEASKLKERAKYFEGHRKLDALLKETRAYDAWTFEEERQIVTDKAEENARPDTFGFLHELIADSYQEAPAEFEEQLEKASPDVRADPQVALACVRARGKLLGHFDRAIQSDPEIVGAAARNNPQAMMFVDEDLRGKREFMLRVLQKQGLALKWAKDELQRSKEVVTIAVSSCGDALGDASQDLRADKEVVLQAVKNAGTALLFASEECRADPEVVLAAVASDSFVFRAASPELKADKDFLLQVERRSRGDREPGLTRLSDFLGSFVRYLLSDVTCYSEAASSVKEEISEEAFRKACESNLAAPGERVPVLIVTLSRDANDTEESYLCEACLLSGTSFACRVPITSERPQPLVNDLAAVLLEELPKQTEVNDAQYISIVFQRADDVDGDSTCVSAWDWDRPLSEFLSPDV